MKRILMYENKSIPSMAEIRGVLGDKTFEYYKILTENIISMLNPDSEKWDDGGRRGKYYRGFFINKKYMSIDLFLVSNGLITCNFHFQKRDFNKIIKHRKDFSISTQKHIDFRIDLQKKYRGCYLSIMINSDKNLEDAILAINLVANKKK